MSKSSVVIRTQDFRSFNSHTSKLSNQDGRLGIKTDHARRMGLVVSNLHDFGSNGCPTPSNLAEHLNRRYKANGSYTANDMRTSLKRLEHFGITEYSQGAWRLTTRGLSIWEKATIG
jgi:hypothetical protein